MISATEGQVPRKLAFAFLAAIVLITPLVLGSWFALCPEYGDPACPGTAAPQNYFPAVRAASSGLVELFLVINLIVPYIFPLGYIAIAMVSWRRAPWLTAIGLVCGWLGSIAWGFIADELFIWTSLAFANRDAILADLLRRNAADWHLTAVGATWVLGHLFGYLFLGIALWRSRAVPRWSATLLIAAVPIMGPFAYGFRQNIFQILSYVMVAAACVPVARSLLGRMVPQQP